jgi:uncharacterized phage infection (PIP) family protein YhgE
MPDLSFSEKISAFLVRVREILASLDSKIQEKNETIQSLTQENATLKAQLAESAAKDREQEATIAQVNAIAEQARLDAESTKQKLAEEQAAYDQESAQVQSAIDTFLGEVASPGVTPPGEPPTLPIPIPSDEIIPSPDDLIPPDTTPPGVSGFRPRR